MSTPTIPPPPVIERLARKREILDRRRAHLKKRIDSSERGAVPSTYDEAEATALDAALQALDYVEQMVKVTEEAKS